VTTIKQFSKADPGISRREISESLLVTLPTQLHPVLRRVYCARQVSPDELDPLLARMIPVGAFESAIRAACRLADARQNHQRILVLGDFDADGATGTALLVSCLRGLGFEGVDYLVPDRFVYGYGLSPAIAELAAKMQPDLIVTVDNGISSVDGVDRARELGVEVLITDHHLPGKHIPAADIVVNPNVPGDTFPSKVLCGVGVAFYVMAALARELANRGQLPAAEAQAVVVDTLDLVALGTVADLVPLDYNNRILVAEGLRRIRAGRTRPGIQALFQVAGRNPADAQGSDLGFGIAPRLNAAGRLTDMSAGIECLLAAKASEALPLARALDDLNRERRELQASMEADAQLHLETLTENIADEPANAYCLYDDDWHEGGVGLVATRIKDQMQRPVIAFARCDAPGELKGSARSIAGIHIRDVIDAVATRLPGVVPKFGGHAMAAGMTIRADAFDRFSEVFAEEVGRFGHILEQPEVILTDGSLSAADMGIELAEVIRRAGPWGQGFAEPLFDNELEIVEQRLLKQRHLKLKLRHPGGGELTDAIAFNYPELVAPSQDCAVRFVYRLDVNEFRNRRTAQLVVEHIQSD
jgi:single-stranded-DNA-specific exonuclease